MSGILGIWHLDGRPLDRGELEHLCTTLRHRGADDEGIHIDGPAALACCLARTAPESANERQPVVAADGTMVVFDGRLDNREDLLALLPHSAGVSDESPDSSLALAAYREFGTDFPARLTGDFALGVFDSSRKQLLLARDPVGVRPVYYYTADDLFLFASEIKTLLAHRRVRSSPDDEILADFIFTRLRAQHPPERTFFRNISRVLPAHAVVVSPDGTRTHRYWDFDLTRRVRFHQFHEYAEAFEEHFQRAVHRRLRSTAPVAVSVSGGLDSSAIFCTAERLRRADPSGPVVIGMSQIYAEGSPADEQRFLCDIERAYGVTIQRCSTSSLGAFDVADDAIWHVETPWLDSQSASTHALFTAVGRHGARVLLTGHWGDQFLFDDAYLVDLCRRGAWREAWRHMREYGRWVDVAPRHFKLRLGAALGRHYAPDALLPVLRRVRKRLSRTKALRPWYTDEFRRLAGAEHFRREQNPPAATAHAHSLYQEARSRYHLLCMEWNDKTAAMHGLEIAFPFLDKDLIAFLMAIPGEMQTWRGVHKAILREGLRGILPEPIAARVAKADFTRVVNDRLALDYNRLVERLRTGRLVTAWGYVRVQQLEHLRNGRPHFADWTCEPAWAFEDLFALEIWLTEFFGPSDRRTRRNFEDDPSISAR